MYLKHNIQSNIFLSWETNMVHAQLQPSRSNTEKQSESS